VGGWVVVVKGLGSLNSARNQQRLRASGSLQYAIKPVTACRDGTASDIERARTHSYSITAARDRNQRKTRC
jgi:hypothetical protein